MHDDTPSPEGSGALRRSDFLKGAVVAGAGATALGPLVAQAGATGKGRPRRPAQIAREAGIYENVTRILWITVNVSDLERSVDFYERTYPVTRRERTNGPAQAFTTLGIGHGQFEGRLMRDVQPFQGRCLHLVQWTSPGPVGEPYKEANHVGFYRHHATASRSGLHAAYDRVVAEGGRPYGEPSFIYTTPTSGTNAFGFLDPDGTTLEWVGGLDPNPNGVPDNISAYNANCRDLKRSYRFYRDVMGQDINARLNPITPQAPGSASLGDTLRNPDGSLYLGQIDFDAVTTGYRADFRNVHDLLEWQMPRPYGDPYPTPNHLGSVNVTWEVDDVQACYEKLAKLRVRGIGGGRLVAPEKWDLGEYGERTVMNFVDPDGIQISLHERPAPAAESQQPI